VRTVKLPASKLRAGPSTCPGEEMSVYMLEGEVHNFGVCICKVTRKRLYHQETSLFLFAKICDLASQGLSFPICKWRIVNSICVYITNGAL
jgi:hypothetical protein